MGLIILVIGILIGLLIERYIFSRKANWFASSRSFRSDSGPYLFLELDPGGANEIYKKQRVSLRVEIKNYISHK